MDQDLRLGGGAIAMAAHVALPLPPSINACFRNVRGVGRVRTRTYRRWADAAGWELLSERPPHIRGQVSISIRAARPSRRSDLDNRIKPLLDLLVTCLVIEDDRHVMSVSARWDDAIEAGRCHISIEQIGGAS